MNITEIAIRRPSLIIVLFSVFTLLGYIGFRNLSYELMPDFDQPVVVIKTAYPGADPEEVETSVSRKIEDALANLEGIDYLVTKSLPNASVVIANMKYGTDLDKTMTDAQRFIENIRKDLPEDVLNPEMSKVSPNDLPMMSISATSQWEGVEFYQRMTDDFLPRMQQLQGVAEITLLGGEQREIQVRLDRGKLKRHGISIVQVTEAIRRSGLDLPAGSVQSSNSDFGLRLEGKFTSLQQIAGVQVALPAPGSPVYVRDLATVTDGVRDRTSVSRYNGKNGIGLLIKKQGDANSVEVSKNVREELQKLREENASFGLEFAIADDSTDNTLAAVHSVLVDLLLAVVLVSAVMVLFLGNLRNSFIVLVAIPTSLITAFAVMWLLNYTLNLMTLLAMSLVIGILVDDATVVLENIQRHLDMGKEKRRAALEGRMEIGFSALSITLVDVVVFLPILFLQVFVADMLKQFSVVVVTSTLTSLLVGFTLTPWLASRIGKGENRMSGNRGNFFLRGFERGLNGVTEAYTRQLNWVLRHRFWFLFIVLLLFGATGAIMKQGIIGKELIATGDQGKFRMNLEFDKFTPLARNDSLSEIMEGRILAMPQVATVFSNVGGPGTGIGSLGVGEKYKTEFTVQLKPRRETGLRTEEFMQGLRDSLWRDFPGVNISMAALGLVPRTAPIEITLSGSDADQVMETARRWRDVVEGIPGADNVRLSIEEGRPEYRLVPDADKMQRLGLRAAVVGAELRSAFSGNDDAQLTEKGTEYPVRVWLEGFDRESYDDVGRLTVLNGAGIPIEVAQFARIDRGVSPSLLERKDRQPAVTLTAEALGRPSGSVADDVVRYVRENPLPAGLEMAWGSDIKRQNDSFGALGSVLIISFLLIYLILVALYDSFLDPFVVLFSIPVAAIGAFLALNLSLNHLSLFALLGLIMLMGLVTKNAILIVDFTNQLKLDGRPYRDALLEAGKGRLRPILMTTLSMVFGMLPIALATGTAAAWKNGLAWVIIGGLLSSLLLTVYLVPVVYSFKESLLHRLARSGPRKA